MNHVVQVRRQELSLLNSLNCIVVSGYIDPHFKLMKRTKLSSFLETTKFSVEFTNFTNCGMYIPLSDDEHRFVQKVCPHMVTGSADVIVTQLLCYHMPLLYYMQSFNLPNYSN